MKKLTCVTLTLLTLACVALTGCHGSEGLPAFAVPEAFDTGRDYEITFWAKNDTNIRQTTVYKQAIEDFEALYPNIHVNMKLYTDYNRIYNDVITNISTDTTPNVCVTYPDHIATYITGNNVVVPLDELAADARYGLGGSELAFDGPSADEMIGKFMDECVLNGHQYALPYMRSTEACYVNKDLVEKLGYTLPETLTWDFVFEVSEAAMAKNADGTFAVNGQTVMIPFIYKSTDNMMIQMLKQKGAGYSTETGEIKLFNPTTTELLFDVAEHAKTKSFSTFKIVSYPGNFLNAGQCIFAIDSTAGATWMGCDAPLLDISEDKLVRFNTEVMMLPQFDPEHPQMISQGPSVCVFNKEDPQEVMASWLFTQFLLTDKVQVGYARTEGYVPVTAKAQESAGYLDYLSRAGEDNDDFYAVKIAASKLLLDHVDDTFITPVFNGSASLRNAAGQLIENTVKSVNRKETVDDEYMTRMTGDVISLYRLNQLSRGGANAAEKADLGPLPGAAKALLITLPCVWAVLIAIVAAAAAKKKKSR